MALTEAEALRREGAMPSPYAVIPGQQSAAETAPIQQQQKVTKQEVDALKNRVFALLDRLKSNGTPKREIEARKTAVQIDYTNLRIRGQDRVTLKEKIERKIANIEAIFNEQVLSLNKELTHFLNHERTTPATNGKVYPLYFQHPDPNVSLEPKKVQAFLRTQLTHLEKQNPKTALEEETVKILLDAILKMDIMAAKAL